MHGDDCVHTNAEQSLDTGGKLICAEVKFRDGKVSSHTDPLLYTFSGRPLSTQYLKFPGITNHSRMTALIYNSLWNTSLAVSLFLSFS